MSQKGLSSRLQQMKFMQRGKMKEEVVQKREEEKKSFEDEHWILESSDTSSSISKCIVFIEGDPKPEQTLGRFSFKSFNPTVEKLNSEIMGRPNLRKSENENDNQKGKRKTEATQNHLDAEEKDKKQKTQKPNSYDHFEPPQKSMHAKNQQSKNQSQNRRPDGDQKRKAADFTSGSSGNKQTKRQNSNLNSDPNHLGNENSVNKNESSKHGNGLFASKENWRKLRPGN